LKLSDLMNIKNMSLIINGETRKLVQIRVNDSLSHAWFAAWAGPCSVLCGRRFCNLDLDGFQLHGATRTLRNLVVELILNVHVSSSRIARSHA
ncbi:MAG: hypothetical protein AAF317_09220, partial [Pseudomonadota bacterium]